MTFAYVVALLAAFGFVFLLLPRIVFPVHLVEGTFLDRMVAGGVWMTALTCAAMYVLGTFGALESVGIVAALVAAWWYFRGRHGAPGRGVRLGERFFAFSDLAESKGTRNALAEIRDNGSGGARRGIRAYMDDARARYTGPVDIVVGVLVVVVLVVAAYLRFSRAWSHVELVPQDSFLALYWTKTITAGELLKDGTYPQGTYMWMSLLDRVYPYDAYQLTRFAGPLMNAIELVVLYWAASRVTRSRAAGLLAAAVFGLFAGHFHLLVVWPRQIGAMTQEFALGFGIASLLFGAQYMVERRTVDLTLAGAALFVAVTSNTLVIPFMLFGYAAIILVGVVTGSLWGKPLGRLIATGLIAFLAGNYFFLLGWLRGIPLAQSFTFYDPLGSQSFTSAGAPNDILNVTAGTQLKLNPLFQLAIVGCVIAIVAGVLLIRRSSGKTLLAWGGAVLSMLLFYDLLTPRFGVLFRVRQGWVSGELMALSLGLGVGALALFGAQILRAGDTLWRRGEGGIPRTAPAVQVAAIAVAAILFLALWPRYSAFAREAGPSGYPTADRVALRALDRHEAFTTTLVGGPEQFQETATRGFFVEAWVFARDVSFSGARDPGYELTIPTNDVYVFAEKLPFEGPQARPYGPAQEFYRDIIHRTRIEQRILAWCEEYMRFHKDMDVFYEDDEIRVYHLQRKVDLDRAEASPDFKDYTWAEDMWFDDDGDVVVDRVRPNPRAKRPS